MCIQYIHLEIVSPDQTPFNNENTQTHTKITQQIQSLWDCNTRKFFLKRFSCLTTQHKSQHFLQSGTSCYYRALGIFKKVTQPEKIATAKYSLYQDLQNVGCYLFTRSQVPYFNRNIKTIKHIISFLLNARICFKFRFLS